MDVEVIHKLANRLPRPLLPSVLGEGLPERLRSTSLALVGLVGAAALVTIGLTLQHGAPLVSSGPIHAPARSEVAPARVVAKAASVLKPHRARSAPAAQSLGVVTARPAPAPPTAEPVPIATPVPDAESAPAPVTKPHPKGNGGEQAGQPVARTPPESSGAPTPAPVPAATPEPEQRPVATPSSEPPPPVTAPPTEEPSPVPGNGNAYGKGSGTGPEGSGPPGLAKK